MTIACCSRIFKEHFKDPFGAPTNAQVTVRSPEHEIFLSQPVQIIRSTFYQSEQNVHISKSQAVMPVQMIKTHAPRYKAYKPAPIVHHIAHPRGNGLRIYHGEEWFTGNEVVQQTIALLSPRKIPKQHSGKLSKSKHRATEYDTIQVFDSAKKSQELGRGLQIHSLAGGIGIAVTGRYSHSLKSGQVRYDAFLAHLVEGRMRETLKQLLFDVAEAKKKGFHILSLLVCYRDEKTLGQDMRMIWNSKTVSEEVKLRESLMQMLEEVLGETPDVVPYHVLEEKSLCIDTEKLIRIVNV